jgi:hypothetical protein
VPKFTSFQRIGKKASVYVGTGKNVIASLNPKNGNVGKFLGEPGLIGSKDFRA